MLTSETGADPHTGAGAGGLLSQARRWGRWEPMEGLGHRPGHLALLLLGEGVSWPDSGVGHPTATSPSPLGFGGPWATTSYNLL